MTKTGIEETVPTDNKDNLIDEEAEDFGNNIVSVVDEEGVEHIFEELDRIETDEGKFIALLPIYDEAEEVLEDSGELIILSVDDENDEIYLEPIEDEELLKRCY